MNLSARQIAKQRGLHHYRGKICGKHPTLDGRRYTGSGSCTMCAFINDRDRKDRIKNAEH